MTGLVNASDTTCPDQDQRALPHMLEYSAIDALPAGIRSAGETSGIGAAMPVPSLS